MRKFSTFLIFTMLLSLLSSFLITLRYPGEYPKQLSPNFDDNLRMNHRDYLNEEKPEIMILGDSTLRNSVIFDQLGEALDMDVYGVAVPSSTTALWYLILKNNIITAEHKPAYLVIFTRETIMTTPEYRVGSGNNFTIIDEYAASDEPQLTERSFLQKMSVPERITARYLPVFGERDQVRGSINYRIDHSLPVLNGCGDFCVNKALNNIFLGETDRQAAQEQQTRTESFLWELKRLIFSRQLDRSYLPEIERMTRENDIQLILVEMKTHHSPPSTTTSLLLDRYMRDLRAYCAEKGIVYISFSDDPRLTRDLFPDGFHLAEKTMPMFTDMLAEELAKAIP